MSIEGKDELALTVFWAFDPSGVNVYYLRCKVTNAKDDETAVAYSPATTANITK